MAAEPQVVSHEELLERALARIENLELELASFAAPRCHEVAIVGLAARLPGAPDLDAFWDLLRGGRDAVRDLPPDRWPGTARAGLDRDAVPTAGGYLDSITEFDPALFGISAREAAWIDPQQRLLLEVAWRAFEDAGIVPSEAPRSTGVFVGISNIDYREAVAGAGLGGVDQYFSAGATPSTASGRISYTFGFNGPSMSIDTACSSSLVALHQAVRSLRSGEVDLAVVGGVNLIAAPAETVSLSKAGMLAADGRCKTFDATADGYGRGEGGVVVILRRLDDAVSAGDRVRAVVLGSAVNQDGRRGGLTVPSGKQQQAVIRAALSDAAVTPDRIAGLEAHGTGTALGDPVEMAAIRAVFGARANDLLVGSVKTNIGHLEAAAGGAGLAKCVLSLEHRTLPGHVHLHDPNPRIDWSVPIRVPREPAPLDDDALVGLSSFGFSGTNAHVVLGPAPDVPSSVAARHRPGIVLPLSAHVPIALEGLADRWRAEFEHLDGSAASEAAAAAAVRRPHLRHRVTVVGHDGPAVARELATLRVNELGATSGRAPRIAFACTGQGALRPGGAAGLYATEPVFAAALDRCARAVGPDLGTALIALATGAGSVAAVNDNSIAQPTLFAIDWSLAQWWMAWGIEAVAAIGHSLGGLVAATLAGVLELEDAMAMVAARGRLVQELGGHDGGMVALSLTLPEVEALLASSGEGVSIAAVNGESEIVVSGPADELDPLVVRCEEAGVVCRPLAVSHAFHSSMMDPAVAAFTAAVADMEFRRPSHLVFVSDLMGEVADAEVTDPRYWGRHLREPVRFAAGTAALVGLGVDLVIELGPAPVLTALGQQIDDSIEWLPSVRPGDDLAHLRALGAVHDRGARVDWAAFHGRRPANVRIPELPLDRRSYWFEPIDVCPALLTVAELAWDEDGRAAAAVRDAVELDVGSLRRWSISGANADAVAAALRRSGVDADAANPPTSDAEVSVVIEQTISGAARPDQVASVVHRLISAVRRVTGSAAPEATIIVVTSGGHAVGPDESVSAVGSALWGAARSIAAEHPQVDLRIVDVEPSLVSDELAAALLGAPPRSAVRSGRRFVPHLRPAPSIDLRPPDDPLAVRRLGTHLVTGGLGAVGLAIAEDMARRGAGRLVLATRRGTRHPGADRARALARLGATVEIVECDVADAADVVALIEAATRDGDLHTVVHAAGIEGAGPALSLGQDDLRTILAPKVAGATNLADSLASVRGVEAVLLCSSVSALLEEPRRAAYAAANAFLDGVAAEQRRLGRPWLSVAWGPWADDGMAAGAEAPLRSLGWAPIAPATGAAAVAELASRVALLPAHVIVAPADWARIRSATAGTVPDGFLDRMVEAPSHSSSGLAVLPTFRARVLASSSPESVLVDEVSRTVASILRSPGEPDPTLGFFDLGMDSLMALELSRVLGAGLGVEFGATLAFSHPTVLELAGHLHEVVMASLDTPAGEPAPGPDRLGAQRADDATSIAGGSGDDEVDALLARLAEKLRAHDVM